MNDQAAKDKANADDNLISETLKEAENDENKIQKKLME